MKISVLRNMTSLHGDTPHVTLSSHYIHTALIVKLSLLVFD